MEWASIDTPIGPVTVAADGHGVRAVRFGPPDRPDRSGRTDEPEPGVAPSAERPAADVLAGAVAQLREFFAGQRTEFDLPQASAGGTGFERAVWSELRRIPYGATCTYGEVARAVGEPDAARAVGVACHRNPLPLLVPCHRVVGAGRKLVGFGGGLASKRWLLEHEARVSLERDWSSPGAAPPGEHR